eukprot:jgi/Chlat1/1885/Chrsp145S08694
MVKRWKELLGDRPNGLPPEPPGAEPTIIYDCKGEVVATITSQYVAITDCADSIWQAIVASEDRRFWSHKGVDIRGLARAVISAGRQGGGSTVTQQLVKNMLLSHDRTISRKLVEVVLAIGLEQRMKKPQILEMYLNNVYWGHGITGIAGAASGYFKKKPSQLTLGESAMLAGLLPAPELLSPFRNPQGALQARHGVLQSMVQSGYITEKEADNEDLAGLPESLNLAMNPGARAHGSVLMAPPGAAPYRAPFFVGEVLYQLKHLCGDDAVRSGGGLKIQTTVDLSLQEYAEGLLAEDRSRSNFAGEAALVALEPATGAVRVMVGGRDYSSSPYNRAVLAQRSPGSAFKPFVYLAALALGIATPDTELDDEPVVFDTIDQYMPQNFSQTFRGRVSLKDSLVFSLNIPTVKLASMVRPSNVIAMARRLGVTSELPETLSLALGACEVTPMEIACAYNTIASGGVYTKPHFVTSIKDRHGNTIYKHRPSFYTAVRTEPCKILHSMLKEAVKRGTGKAAVASWRDNAASRTAAGKTGTSDDFRDAWFAGYTPYLSCVVWVGHDDNRPLPGSGATIAAPLWARFMAMAHGKEGIENKDKKKNKRRVENRRKFMSTTAV